MTAMPTLNAGQEPTAGQWQTLLPLFARKLSDQTVNNSATFTNDTALSLTVPGTATFELWLQMIQNSGATPGFKVTVNLPAGGTWLPAKFLCGSSAANLQEGITTTGQIGGITGAAADSIVEVTGVVVITTGGTVQVQWAQNTANASNTIVRAGSVFRLRQVA